MYGSHFDVYDLHASYEGGCCKNISQWSLLGQAKRAELERDKLRDRVGGGLGRDRVGALRVLSMSKLRDRGESGSGPLGGSGDVLGATDRRSLRCPPLYWPPIRGAKV